jgi:hypothetical protein
MTTELVSQQPSTHSLTAIKSLHVGQPEWKCKPIKETMSGRNALTKILAQLYASQKLYGNDAASLPLKDAVFQRVLEDFDFARVEWAFFEYVKHHDDLPAPSNIAQIIRDRKWGAMTL